ncbi:MAG TPA: hypothetical protein VFX70_02975 [Mycobacteriales bacterium]|nr:hypothetical protein [Mycobacteriales bacterium]
MTLNGAAGVELCRLDARVVTDYLKHSAGGPDSAARWDDVAATLVADAGAPVAQALTTPLMAALARVVYNPRVGESPSSVPRHPAELCDRDSFPNRTAVERHLFDAFIPAAYRPRSGGSGGRGWNVGQATRWLTFLARDLEHWQHGTTDLAWWQIRGAAPRPLAGLFVGLVTGIVGALTFPWPGWGIGTICAVAVGLLIRRRTRSGDVSLARGLTGGMLGGQLAALVALTVFGTGVGDTYIGSFLAGGVSSALVLAPMGRFSAGLVGAFVGEAVNAFYERAPALGGIRLPAGSVGVRLADGIALGLVAGLAAGLFYRRTPAHRLRWSLLGTVGGAVCGLLLGSVTWVTTGRSIGLVTGATGIVLGGIMCGLFAAAAPTDLTTATGPGSVLARDRVTFLAMLALAVPVGLVLALGAALSPPDPFLGAYHGLGYGIGVGLAEMTAIGLGLAFLQTSWGGFTLARWWLAATRRLPLRLMTFLDDAHARGVLRQAGAVYQFRHAELQRRLANRPPDRAPS